MSHIIQAQNNINYLPRQMAHGGFFSRTTLFLVWFSNALHSYFRASITGVSLKGLRGCKTLNKDPDPKNRIEGREERDAVTFPGFVDCIYLDAPDEVHLDNGLGDVISIRNTNWSDAVLWNPHLQTEGCYKDFACVENAKIETVLLETGQSWIAKKHLSIG